MEKRLCHQKNSEEEERQVDGYLAKDGIPSETCLACSLCSPQVHQTWYAPHSVIFLPCLFQATNLSVPNRNLSMEIAGKSIG